MPPVIEAQPEMTVLPDVVLPQLAPQPQVAPVFAEFAAATAVTASMDATTPALAVQPALQSAMPEAGLDAALREIYARETSNHVASVRAWLQREQPCPAPHVLPEAIYRACHTMCGSSKMAEARHGIRLAAPIEHWLRLSYDSGVGFDDADLALLADCMTAMESVAGHLDESTGYFVVHETLRARVARAEVELERRINESVSRLEDSGLRLAPMPLSADADFDPEVAAIFCEEAAELLDAAQSALSDWNADRADVAHIAALKRPLHTLKGGARMAGITAMGDLSHELESLVVQIELGLATRGDEARRVVQQGLDELARMRDAALAGRATPSALTLIARIKDAAQPARTAPPLMDAAPVAPPPVVAAPPEPISAADAFDMSIEGEDEAPSQVLELTTAAAPEAVAQPAVVPEAAPAASAEPPPLPAAVLPPGREPQVAAERGEMARVSAELLDQLLNGAGEVSIARARLEQQLAAVEFNLGELSRTVTRLKEQLRKLELETEAQILHRHGADPAHRSDFDPLELDRYSSIQQFSRALAESASDVASLQQLLETMVTEAQSQLQLQGRLVAELQNGLMNTRMVPFQRHVQRLSRIVRQAAQDAGRPAELIVEGGTGELDRQVLDRMLPPLEHMLRNAVVHGIEAPALRQARHKDAVGHINLNLRREGAEVIIELSDDGGGMDLSAIRAKGLDLGLLTAGQEVSQDDLIQLVLEPGFSTADTVTQQAGRGVGMDVVATEIKTLGGALYIDTSPGKGTRFTVKLPFTLATSHALVLRVGDEVYALPLPTIEGVVRLPRDEIAAHLRSDSASFTHGGNKYRVQPLAQFVGLEASALPEQDAALPLVLVRAGEYSAALVADELIGSREIVVKPVGPQLASIRGISGATILSDGRVVVILDIVALVRGGRRGRAQPLIAREPTDQRVFVMVVDDSITVRRVTQRLLERNGMRVLTARDGMDAMALLQENRPDIILLDIEMPRMDGYEVASQVRADPVHHNVPIIMITSRVGDKHRARAIELGVNDYLGKPYQESQLLNAIAPLVAARRNAQPG
jgi:chemosensory pili system protein ChpA (sensor histidine kinase/response regulator)